LNTDNGGILFSIDPANGNSVQQYVLNTTLTQMTNVDQLYQFSDGNLYFWAETVTSLLAVGKFDLTKKEFSYLANVTLGYRDSTPQSIVEGADGFAYAILASTDQILRFSLTQNNLQGFELVYDFSSAAAPFGVLAASDKKLYGITCGGYFNEGTAAFQIDSNSKATKLLHFFNRGIEGFGAVNLPVEGPSGQLYTVINNQFSFFPPIFSLTGAVIIIPDPSIILTTAYLYELSKDGSTHKIVADFKSDEGSNPKGMVVVGNNVYGFVQNPTALWRYNIASKVKSIVFTFNQTSGPANPNDPLVSPVASNIIFATCADSDVNLVGSAESGVGGILAFDINTNTVKLIKAFTRDNSEAYNPSLTLLAANDGWIYGKCLNSLPME
jgi:hypothetical protein